MIEYICEDCGEIFEKPHTYVERHGLECGPYEKWSVCPYCGSPGYKEYREEDEDDVQNEEDEEI